MKIGFTRLKRIEVKGKTGFRNITGNSIILLDERGIVFYDTTPLPKKVWEFNLPAGEYYVLSGKFREMLSPVVYPLTPLPAPERYKIRNPENFEVKFIENPYTGSVFWDIGKIYLDNSLEDLRIPDMVFVLYHEYGHRFYKSEHQCDVFAKNQMLDVGYNPSQIGEGVIHTLSDNNFHRKQKLIDKL